MTRATTIILFFILALFSVVSHAEAAPLLLKDQVIRTNTTWSGDIIINGTIVVGRGATLKISPGTTVRFQKKDSNHDGTGDSEIRVLGRIVAQGTTDRRIIFSSAEESPARKDWSYLLIFASGEENIIQHCDFHHGFTGLQVHFSVARIYDCKFINNHEGLRFGRGEITIENNSFMNNDVGIRFTRMEGPVVIRYNKITQNRIGVFLVPSGQNITDFFDPDRSGRAWNTGHLLVIGNNIFENTLYNLNLGDKQLWTLDVSKNWWGSADSKTIRTNIFDANRDESLGKAIIEPVLKHQASQAGIRKD